MSPSAPALRPLVPAGFDPEVAEAFDLFVEEAALELEDLRIGALAGVNYGRSPIAHCTEMGQSSAYRWEVVIVSEPLATAREVATYEAQRR